MSEFMNVIIILLAIAGWCLVAFAAKDIFITIRLNSKRGNGKAGLFYKSSTSRLTKAIYRFTKTNKNRQFYLRNTGFIVPFSQYIIWKTMLVAGFGFLYLALDWQDIGDESNFHFFAEIGSTFWLSLSIFTRLAHYEFAPDRIGIHILANIQFYAGVIFYGFIFIYFLTLRRRAKKIQPFLYRLKSELEKPYSAFNFSDNLNRFGANELSIILQDWEIWANDLRRNLQASPTLIFNRPRNENPSWLAAANIILDASAAIIITSDGANKSQAKATFAAVRRLAAETVDYLNIAPQRAVRISEFHDRRTHSIFEADVLSAEIVYDERQEYFASERDEKLFVRQFTYRSYLTLLAEYLEVELPSRNEKTNVEYAVLPD